MRKKILLWLGLALFSAKAQTPLDIRIALVIGNSAYANVPALDNAGNDAKSIGQALRTLGFTVIEVRDGSKVQMTTAIEKMRNDLQGQQALGMLYYAGHGLQVDWRNYMLPVDVRLTRAVDLPQQAVDVAAVVNIFKAAGTRMNILVLDACRNNPFTSTASGKGLAPMDAPPGTLLAYATQPGNVAEDGEAGSGNGPYALYLQTELYRPFAKVEDVFKRVRLQVRQKTEGRQIPWESTSLEEDFVFNDGTRHSVKSEELDRLAAEAKRREQDMIQRAAQARDREKQIAIELEKERRAQAEAARLADIQRQAELARAQEAERQAAIEREKEQQRVAAETRRIEEEQKLQMAQAKERERLLAEEQAKEQERQRELELKKEQAAQRELADSRERERLIAVALEKERQAQAAAERLATQQRLAAQLKAQEAMKLALKVQEQERQRQADEARRTERERKTQEAKALERERTLAQAQAKEQERQRALAQALAREKELDARRQQMVQALDDELKARETFARLSKEQQREQTFAAEKAGWDRIRDSAAAADVYAYLDKHPNGSISELAQAKLEKLDKPKIEPTADQTGQIQPFEAKRFRVGDNYQFVVRDLLTKLETGKPSFTVLKAHADSVEFNQGYKVTHSGAIIRTIGGATLDPYQQWIPAGEYQVGKKWHTRSNMTLPEGNTIWVEMTGRIVARENITVPAGTFDTYKMELEQTSQDGTRLKVTYWGQPDWGVAIKQIREVRDTRGTLSGQIYELTARKRGG